MNTTLFLILFATLGVIYLIIGTIASRGIRGQSDYFLASNELGLVSITLSLVATQIGGGAVLGAANEAYNSGIWGVAYNLGMVLGFLFLGFGFAAKLRDTGASTVAELFEMYYKSPNLKRVASFFSVISLFGILVAQVVASRSLLIGVGLGDLWILFLFWGIVITYTVVGGFKAVVYTDVLQIMVVIVIFIVVYFISVHHSLMNGLPSPPLMNYMNGVAMNTENVFKVDMAKIWPLFLMPLFFSMVEQDLAQRFFAIKTREMATKSATLSALIILCFSVIPIHLGMKAKLMGLVPPAGASVLIWCLKSFLSPSMVAIVVVALTAVIISTACSLLCAVSSNLVLDFDWVKKANPFFKGKISELITLLVGLAAVFLGIKFDNILGILVKSYELPVVCIFVPLMAAFFYPRHEVAQMKNSAVASFVAGGGSLILFQFLAVDFFPFGTPRELVALILSAFAFLGMNHIRRYN